MINNCINITFNRKRHTTPSTIEFCQKRDQDSIIPAKLHRDLFAEMLLTDPTTKMINTDWNVFTHSTKLPIGKEYDLSSTTATENNTKFNTVKVYICFKIESTTQHKRYLYNNDGGKTILPLLKNNNLWMKWNTFSTHREFFIGFIKFINPVVTLQNAVRYRVALALCSTKLTPNEAKKFTVTTSNKNENQQKKDVNDTNNGIHDELGDHAPIQLPAFDILSKK